MQALRATVSYSLKITNLSSKVKQKEKSDEQIVFFRSPFRITVLEAYTPLHSKRNVCLSAKKNLYWLRQNFASRSAFWNIYACCGAIVKMQAQKRPRRDRLVIGNLDFFHFQCPDTCLVAVHDDDQVIGIAAKADASAAHRCESVPVESGSGTEDPIGGAGD
jgi:hypothetical protein